MRQWDHYEFKISGHYLSALINGDHSGLEDSEIAELNQWEQWAFQNARDSGFTVGHWSHDSEEFDNWGRCDVSGLFSDRQTLRLMVYKETK